MNILFVCSGNRTGTPSSVVQNQAKSIQQVGHNVVFFLIKGKGIKGYFKNVKKLKKELQFNKYDIIHSHGISSIVTTLANARPHVVSLLGSEVLENWLRRFFFKFLSRFFWDRTIVKSSHLRNSVAILKNQKIELIPNGVDFNHFNKINRLEAKKELSFSLSKKTILFFADPTRKSKNFSLAQKSIDIVLNDSIEFKVVWDIPYKQVPKYLFACDILLITSLWEGSPNVVKEAMACNRPVVATNVGDIAWLFGKEPGHFLTEFSPEDVAKKLMMALDFIEREDITNGRTRIMELGLDSEIVANRIISVYKSVLISAQ